MVLQKNDFYFDDAIIQAVKELKQPPNDVEIPQKPQTGMMLYLTKVSFFSSVNKFL